MFGFKMGWMAIQHEDIDEIIDQLALEKLEKTDFDVGIAKAYEDETGDTGVFVTEPVDGWSLVIGMWAGGNGLAEDIEAMETIISKLSSKFGQVQAFANYRTVDYFVWMKAEQGELIRSFAYISEGDGLLANKGEITKVEREIGLTEEFIGDWDAEGAEDSWWPNEEHVFVVAGDWGRHPGDGEEADFGYWCRPVKTMVELGRKYS